jgi:hypothetical protein
MLKLKFKRHSKIDSLKGTLTSDFIRSFKIEVLRNL